MITIERQWKYQSFKSPFSRLIINLKNSLLPYLMDKETSNFEFTTIAITIIVVNTATATTAVDGFEMIGWHFSVVIIAR